MGVSVKARCAAIPFCLSGLPPPGKVPPARSPNLRRIVHLSKNTILARMFSSLGREPKGRSPSVRRLDC